MMEQPQQTLLKASFNPVIRVYILLYVAFFLLISIIGIPLMIIWFFGVGQWYSRHYFAKLECELTTRNLRFRKGIIFQVEKTIPLENIQDLTFTEGPLLRYFHLAMLKVETAGQGDFHGNQMQLIGIVDAKEFRNAVLEQRQKIKHQPVQAVNDHETLKAIRDSLLRIECLLAERNT